MIQYLQTAGTWQILYPQQTPGMWIVPPPGVCLCPWLGWEPRKGSRSTQCGHHPPYEEQRLAARVTWVSAHTMSICPLPLVQGLTPRDSSASRGTHTKPSVLFSQSAHTMLWTGLHSQQPPLAAMFPGGAGRETCLGAGEAGSQLPHLYSLRGSCQKQNKTKQNKNAQ